ncbi:neprilysin-1-like [Amblyomma americanum]
MAGFWPLVLLSAVCSTTAIHNHLLPRLQCKPTIVCEVPACKERAELILASVNKSADPCVDFYGFVCDRYNDAHPIPDDSFQMGPFVQAGLKVKHDLKEILDGLPVVPEANSAREKAAVAYHACMNTAVSEEDSLGAVRRALASSGLGEWPILDDSEMDGVNRLEDVARKTGLDSLFSVGVVKDMDDVSLHILQVEQKSTPYLESVFHVSNEHSVTLEELFRDLATTAASLVKPNATDEQLESYINATLSFSAQLHLAQQPPEEKRNARKNYRKGTIEEFQQEIPGLDLYEMLNEELRKVNITLRKQDKIVVNALHHVNATTQVYLQAEPVVVYNYIGLSKAVELLQLASTEFAALMARLHRIVLGVRTETARWERCISNLQSIMKDVVGRLYTEKRLNKGAKEEVERLVREIGLSYHSRLRDVAWMDRETRQKATEKLWAMTTRIAYPDVFLSDEHINKKYHDFGTLHSNEHFVEIYERFKQLDYTKTLLKLRERVNKTNEWTVSAAEDVNAYYSADTNEIDIPGGILQEPFFQEGLPTYINLGAIGSIIGHEITHGYDDQGSQYDSEGRLVNWWSNRTEQEFNAKKKCFIEQYGSVVDPVTNSSIHGENTVGENIADNGGVRVAFATYRRLSECGATEIIPGLEDFSPEQLYFISYALVWCASTRDEIKNEVMSDVHSPHKYRVNVPLRNMDEFASAFDCRRGTPMHSPDEEKCVLW